MSYEGLGRDHLKWTQLQETRSDTSYPEDIFTPPEAWHGVTIPIPKEIQLPSSAGEIFYLPNDEEKGLCLTKCSPVAETAKLNNQEI